MTDEPDLARAIASELHAKMSHALEGTTNTDEALERLGFDPPDPSKKVKIVWLMPNETLLTFGENDEQLVDLQGPVWEVIRPLHRRSTPETEWKGMFEEDPNWREILADDAFWARLESEEPSAER